MYVSGLGALGQTMARFAALFITFFVMYVLFAFVVSLLLPVVEKNQLFITSGDYAAFFMRLLKASAILLPICTLIMLVYELFDETANSVLFLFVLILSLGFVAGCFYPLSFLPESIRVASVFTVTRTMFCYVSACISSEVAAPWFWGMLIHGLVLFGIMVWIRKRKLNGKEGHG